MNALKFALSATAALVLAACGNGGTYQPDLTHAPTVTPKPSAPPTTGGNAGGSSSANNAGGGTSSGSPATGGSATPNTGSTPNAGATPNTGNTPNTGSQPSAGNNTASTPSGKYTGHFVSGNTALQGENKMIANDDYSQISINGVVIPLPAGTSQAGFPIGSNVNSITKAKLGVDAVNTLSVGKDLKHAVYGFIQDYNGLADNTRFAFIQGEESKSVPSTGKVQYQGAAILTHALKEERSQGYMRWSTEATSEGAVNLTADFGNKTLEGKVESPFGNVPLSATIKGSKFEGMDDREGWETKGAFYGPDAAEVAGTFRNLKNQTNPTIGAFGAKQVKPE